MPADVIDLAPFFKDGCWMLVLLAKEASVGVILRRGPTRWWHVTLWNTREDLLSMGSGFEDLSNRKGATFRPMGSY